MVWNDMAAGGGKMDRQQPAAQMNRTESVRLVRLERRSFQHMKIIASIFIGFVHDFAAGCWAATVFAVYWLHRQNGSMELLQSISALQRQFFYGGLICAGTVFLTGAGRSFTYTADVYGPDAELTRRRMLIGKHILLFVVFGAGTYWQYTIAFS